MVPHDLLLDSLLTTDKIHDTGVNITIMFYNNKR